MRHSLWNGRTRDSLLRFSFLANVRVMHLERRENSCAQEFSVRFTRCFGNEKTEDYVTGIAVRPASLWRKFSALFLFQQLQDFGVLNLFLGRPKRTICFLRFFH